MYSMIYSNDNRLPHSKIHKSHKYKKSVTKEYILHYCIYVEFKNIVKTKLYNYIYIHAKDGSWTPSSHHIQKLTQKGCIPKHKL